MWHVSSRSAVATLQTAIHLLLTYLQPVMVDETPDLQDRGRDGLKTQTETVPPLTLSLSLSIPPYPFTSSTSLPFAIPTLSFPFPVSPPPYNG